MKKYLKELTLDEVIDRLKSGESIKYDTSDAETKYRDNMLLTILPDGKYTINVQISSCLNRVAYFETPEEFKLETGKCYRTREGRKVAIVGIDYSREDYPFWGGVIGACFSSCWASNGRFDLERETKNDLISEWSDDDVAED